MRTGLAITLAAALIITLAAAGCGRKGDLIIPGTVLPQPVADLKAVPEGGTIILTWTMPEKNTSGGPLTDLAGFRVLRAELPAGKGDCPCLFAEAGYVDLELPDKAIVQSRRVVWADRSPEIIFGGRYAYQVLGVNRDNFAGQASNTAKAVLLVPPKAPETLTARPGNRSVALEWTPVATDAEGSAMPDFAGYEISRADAPSGPETAITKGPVKDAAYTDTGLVNGKKYYYTVKTLRGSEPPYTPGPPSPRAEAVPSDVEPPSTPKGLVAVPGEGVVLLSWDISPETDVAGYIVYRREPGEQGFRALTEGPVNRITFEDRDASAPGTYAYAVTAVDGATPPNEGPRSAAVEVKVGQTAEP